MLLTKVLLNFTLIILYTRSSVSASLTTSYTGRPCPGEDVTLTCTVTGNQLTWESDVISVIHYIRRFIMVNSTNEQFGIIATVTNITNDTITSTLMITGTFWLNNERSMFSCRGVGSVTAQSAGSPSPPVSFNHSVLSSSAEGASVSVQWDPPTDNGGRDDLTYTVTISPLAQLSATVVTSTSVTVSANYSVSYTVSVVAQSCVNGTSMAGRYTFNVDPPVMCALPSPPANGSIVNVTTLPAFLVKGTVIYYRCAQGLYPSEDQPSTCGTDGMWSPDPGRIVCFTEPFTCSLPASPTNGFVVLISNSTVMFGCSEGFSPQENKTAVCVASNQWSPSIEETVCTLGDNNIIRTVSSDVTTAGGSIAGPVAGGVIGGIVTVVIVIVIILVVLFTLRKCSNKPIKSDQIMEMTDQLQGEYSELRHDGPKKNSTKSKPPPPDNEGYNRITHKLDPGSQAYDDVTVNAEKANPNSEGYSTVKNGQGVQILPGYGQLDNVPTVEAVVYADLGVVTKKKRSEAPEVDQHTVTYSTLDMAATSRMKASTMPAPSKGGSAEQADKLLNLDQALVQLRPVQSRWKELADALRVPETYIQQVDDMYGKDHASSMTEIIDYWMRSCGGRPTWRELADALKRMKEDSLAQQLMSIYDTGQLPVELDMNEVPKELYKYDNAPPPPVPARSPTVTDTDSPGLSRTLPPPSKPPRHGDDHPPPCRPPKPPPKNESPAPPRPPKPPPKN